MRYFSLCLLVTLFGARAVSAQTNTFPSTGNAGIGTTSPASTLELQNNTLNTASAPFITLRNKGTNNYYFDTHVVGGIMGASYRDVRDPAYIAGLWFERKPAVNALSSQGDIVFGTTTEPLYLNEGLPSERMRITSTGWVGIGTASPENMFQVNGAAQSYLTVHKTVEGLTGYIGRAGTITGGYSDIPNAYAVTYMMRDFVIGGWSKSAGTWMGPALYINSDNNNILIGKATQSNPNYKLDVAGNIRANKITVNTTGADFVFDETYHLPTLYELEQFIRKNKHLPGIAPATDMQRDGMEVGEQQTKLLQKVEELTLYIIELNKKLDAQAKEIAELKK